MLLHYCPVILSWRWKVPQQRICTCQNRLFQKTTSDRKKDEENEAKNFLTFISPRFDSCSFSSHRYNEEKSLEEVVFGCVWLFGCCLVLFFNRERNHIGLKSVLITAGLKCFISCNELYFLNHESKFLSAKSMHMMATVLLDRSCVLGFANDST